MMRTQIPKFRLPESVIDEEMGYVLDMGIDFRPGQRIDSMRALLGQRLDAVFVGSGAPRGRDLDVPGRAEAAANIHIGIDWLVERVVRPRHAHRQARDRAWAAATRPWTAAVARGDWAATRCRWWCAPASTR